MTKVTITNEVIKEVLDRLIPGVLHGVYGKAGSGKTTFCMHIIADYISSNNKVVVIDTENGFFMERMRDFVDVEREEVLDNILLRKVIDLNDLRRALNDVKGLINSRNISLIVIDSLSTPYRVEFKDEKNIWEVNRLMGRTILDLKKISFNHKIPVLATHQVYTDFDTGKLEVVGRDLIKYDFKVMLYIDYDQERDKRYLKLVRHPFAESKEVSFTIKKEGFRKRRFI